MRSLQFRSESLYGPLELRRFCPTGMVQRRDLLRLLRPLLVEAVAQLVNRAVKLAGGRAMRLQLLLDLLLMRAVPLVGSHPQGLDRLTQLRDFGEANRRGAVDLSGGFLPQRFERVAQLVDGALQLA